MKAEEGQWIPTEFSVQDLKRRINIRGNKIEVFVSPYDIPKAIRGYRDPDAGRIVIEMKYITEDEPTKTQKISDWISCAIGKASSRIYSISVVAKTAEFRAGDEIRRDASMKELVQCIDEMANAATRSASKNNPEMVKQAIISHSSELLEFV